MSSHVNRYDSWVPTRSGMAAFVADKYGALIADWMGTMSAWLAPPSRCASGRVRATGWHLAGLRGVLGQSGAVLVWTLALATNALGTQIDDSCPQISLSEFVERANKYVPAELSADAKEIVFKTIDIRIPNYRDNVYCESLNPASPEYQEEYIFVKRERKSVLFFV